MTIPLSPVITPSHSRKSTLWKIAASVLFAAFTATACPAQKWINPCASTATAQVATLKNGTSSTDVCSFLERTYEEVDNRCGISFTRKLLHPSTWSGTKPYGIVPDADWQSVPLQAYPGGKNSAEWTEFSIPSLARLMTTTMPKASTLSGALPPDDWKTLVELPKAEPGKLYFNPTTDPVVLFDDGNSHSSHTITCSSAATVSQSGNVNLPLLSVSEKFTAQENNSSSTELAYGTFLSPMGYLQETYPSSFLFEELDLYRRYQNANIAFSPSLVYLRGVEGVIVYETTKSTSATDLSAGASGGIAVPQGGVSGSASGDQKYGSAQSAYLFHALLHNEDWAPIEDPAGIKKKLTEMAAAGTLTSSTNPLALKAAYDTKSGKVIGSFVIVGLPKNLCDAQIANPSFVAPDTKAILTAEHQSTAAQIKAAAKPPATPPPPACVFTVSTNDDSGVPITGTLNYTIDTGNTVAIAFNLPYKLDLPTLQIIEAVQPTSTTAEFWVQVQQPDKIDTKQAASIAPVKKGDPPSITCDKTLVPNPTASVAFANSYIPTAAAGAAPKVTTTGTFLNIQYRFSLASAPKVCTPGDNVTLISPTGAPLSIPLRPANQ